MTSWEDVINQVVIPGDAGAIAKAKLGWTTVFQHMRLAKHYLDEGLTDLEAWEGEASQTYREKIGQIAEKLGTLDTDNYEIVDALATASEEMSTALSKIPIPAEMIHDVVQAKENFTSSGRFTVLGSGAIYERLRGFYESGVLVVLC